MSKKITLLLGIHNHQPVGNFEHVFEKAYQDAYEPFLKVISQFPVIKFSLHYSGCLWEWFEKKHPEIFPIITSLVRRGQVSLISGGFYEPIFPILPEEDSRDQIMALNNYLEEKFGLKPRGFWLTERVWEPDIPGIISQTGLEYTMLDDTHFLASGLKKDEIHGVFITEDRGKTLKIFPIDKKLRYIIPFRLPEETIKYLKESRERGVEALTLADDGEKFGLWPGTKKWVYEEKWLFKFLKELQQNDFIETLTFEEYLERQSSFRRVYLPASSYEEMLKWSGGFFRNFLAKYSEAHRLYSKMLYVSEKVHRASCRRENREMKKYLWEGQCSCPYWHGVFGGLYLPHLRRANYTSLIKAENMASEKLREKWPKSIEIDFDHDGEKEILVETRDLNLYFKPSSGAGLFELDYKPRAVNLQDILSRRIEPYHKDIAFSQGNKESRHVSIHEIEKKADFDTRDALVYDEYERSSFLIRMMRDFNEEAVKNGRKGDGEDILIGPYSADVQNRRGRIFLNFEKMAISGASLFRILKKVSLNRRGTEIEYEIELELKKGEWQGYLGVEFCLAILNGETSDTKEGFSIRDNNRNLGVSFTSAPQASWWRGDLKTVSQSEKGYELIPQVVILFPYWKVNLRQGEMVKFYLQEKIS